MSSLSGVTVADDVVSEFQTIKLGKKYSYIQMKISDDKKVIEMEKTVETSNYDDFVKQFPANACRYAVYDFEYELGDSGQRNDLVFVVWYVTPWQAPPTATYLHLLVPGCSVFEAVGPLLGIDVLNLHFHNHKQ